MATVSVCYSSRTVVLNHRPLTVSAVDRWAPGQRFYLVFYFTSILFWGTDITVSDQISVMAREKNDFSDIAFK